MDFGVNRSIDNRIVRTGTEGLQISHMGDGSRVYNNVILMSAQTWKSPFEAAQDYGIQLYTRDGNMELDHNIVIGAAANPLVFKDNQFVGQQKFISALAGPNGSTSIITATGNQAVASIQPVQFMDTTFPADFDYLRVEQWFPKLLSSNAVVKSKYNQNILYKTGDYVM